MITPNFSPFPIINTSRLLMRQLTVADAPQMYFLRSDPALNQFMDRDPDADVAATQEFIEKGIIAGEKGEGVNWAICYKPNDLVIGDVGIWRIDRAHHRGEIGYRLHPDHQGKGIMSEALSAALDYGFEKIGLHSFEANVNPQNIKSVGLLKRLGFRQEAHFTENYYYKGKFSDSIIFSLLEKWRK